MGSSTNANRVSAAHKAKVQGLNEASEPAAKKAQNDRNKKTVQSAAQLKPQDQIKRFAELKQSQIELIDGVANTLTAELSTLQTVVEATKLAREELEQTHGIIAEANSLSALILAQEEQKQEFQDEMTQTKARWEIEQKDRETYRKREDETYRYNLAVSRRKETDDWEQEKQDRIRELDVELVQREAPLAKAEKEVQEKLAELESLRIQVAKAEAAQDAEVKKQVAIATSSLKKDLENQAALERLKLENQNSLLTQQLTSRDSKIADLEQQNRLLSDKYLDATVRVQQIAERAVDATSARPNYFTAPVANGQETGKRN